MSVGVYAGEAVNELPDRVVIKISGKKAVYCGLVTHIVGYSLLHGLFKEREKTNWINQ